MSRPYAEVIGDPIAHSKSPLIHNFWLGKLGIDAEYKARRVATEELEGYFARYRKKEDWRGCNITIPHKIRAAGIVGSNNLLPGYDNFGAINLVVNRSGQLFGANTDVDGVVGPINLWLDAAFNFGPAPRLSIALVGAGGAARAAVFGLENLGFQKSWRFLVRRPEQGEELAALVGGTADILPISSESLDGADILINASPLGMDGKPALELDISGMGNGNWPPPCFRHGLCAN